MKSTLILFSFALLGACTHMGAGPRATANLEPRSGSTASGTVTFAPAGEAVRVRVDVTGVAPNSVHGFHVHENGDCSAADASSAGGHFNPTGAPHGGRSDATRHSGDFGNVTANASGEIHEEFTISFVTTGEGASSVIGRSVVLHQDPDDLKSQPAGNSGKRIACGVITLAQ